MERSERAERDYVSRLAVQHVLNTLHLDGGATARILSCMTNNQLEDLHRDVTSLRDRVEQHLATRGIQAR